MPLLGFGKERLNPDFPLAHRFLIRCGLVIGAYTLGILFPQVAMDRPSMGTGRTLAFQRATITRFCICSIDPYIHHMPRVVVRKLFPLRAGIDVLLRIIEKLIYSHERIALAWLRERHIGADMSILDCLNNVERSIGCIPSHLMR